MRFFVLSLFALACTTDSGIEGDATAGEAVYADNCAVCHGDDGTGGGAYPSIVGVAADEIEEYVINGEGDMPAFGDTLSEQDIADVVAYVQTL